MKHKLVVGLGAAVVGLTAVLLLQIGSQANMQTLAIVSSTELKNSTVLIPDSNIKVKLKNGQATYKKGDVVDNLNYISKVGQTATKNGTDIFVSMADNMGGSGSFVYVGLFHAEGTSLVYKSSSQFLGDRIVIKSAKASVSHENRYQLTVNYLDRRADETLADWPSVPKKIGLNVKNHEFSK